MAAIRTKRLCSALVTTDGGVDQAAVVPAGHRWLCKGFNVVSASSAVRKLSIYCGGVAGNDFIPWWESIQPNTVVMQQTYFVLEPGDSVFLADDGSGSGTVSVTLDLFGVDFTL